MTEKKICFGNFEFPVLGGLEYLVNEALPDTDFLFVNEVGDGFSMYFEKGFPIFTLPTEREREYGLFELRRQDRTIHFFCPQRRENMDTAVWYFYVEIPDASGEIHSLPGQVRVEFDGDCIRRTKGKPKFIEVLEGVRLAAAASL